MLIDSNRLCVAFFLGGILLLPTVVEAGFPEGVGAYKAGNYGVALKEFGNLASKGEMRAQYNLGRILFDAFLGSLLLLGFFTRIVALVSSIHLLTISLGLGYNDIAVRDIGLSIAAFSVFLNGEDSLCLGRRLRRKR